MAIVGGTITGQCFDSVLHPVGRFSYVIHTTYSGSVVVAAYDFESGRPGSSSEWGLINYEASITAQDLPEPSSFRGSTLGTSAAEHKGCNWGMQVD